MKEKPGPLSSRSKVWLQDEDGNVVFGAGRLRILKAIRKNGSIHAAAKELKMGYRAVWARITATEERLGARLLERRTGGPSGGGSELTPLAEELINAFSSVQSEIEQQTDESFRKYLGRSLNLKNFRQP